MSTKYKRSQDVPSDIICQRLDELSTAITEGKRSIEREFTMRVPAELDRDPDLILSTAADRIRSLEEKIRRLSNCDHWFKDKPVDFQVYQCRRYGLLSK